MKMKNRICALIILIFTILGAGSTKGIENANLLEDKNGNLLTSQSMDEETDCKVRQTYSVGNWLGDPMKFMAFIEHGAIITISIGFQGEQIPLVYDKVIMSQEEITLCKIRNGIVNETNLNRYLDTAGWVWIEMSINNGEFILKYDNITALDYTVDQKVNELILHGSNITICKEGTPMWMIDQEQSAKIPLEPSRQAVNPLNRKTYALTLQSDDVFTPCILIDGDKICFGFQNNTITYATSTKPAPIPAGKMDLYLELVAENLNIYKKIDAELIYLTSLYKERVKFIEVTSDNSKFSVSLNLLVQPNSSSDIPSTDYELITRHPNETSVDNGLLIAIVIGVASGVSAFSVLVIGYMILKKQKFAIPWKKSKNSEDNKDSTNQHPQNNLDEKNPLV